MEKVNEKSTAYLTVTFYDRDDQPAQPASATYEIHDLDTGTEIRTLEGLSPTDGVVDITLNKTDNSLVDDENAKEVRVVSIHAVYGADDELHDEYTYEVIGLDQVFS